MRRRIVRRRGDAALARRLAGEGRMHPVLARVYAQRAVQGPDEVAYGLEGLFAPHALKGMEDAVELLAGVAAAGERILVVGDFDADGATSTALALRALRAMGCRADYLVPNRFRYGYGLTPEIVAEAARREPALIVTVDNGISSLAGVEAAVARGIAVLVTDHHLPGAALPAADAIVNPNQPGDDFPSKHLAGVGVIFYVMTALRARLRETGWFAARGLEVPNLAALLDLVALGTVADVVPLDRNNRILVAQGLARIRRGLCCPGILALLEVAGRDHRQVGSSELGFVLGPRLNAAGRLEDMSLGIECLLSDDPAAARVLALRLDELNRRRRHIEAEMQAEALAELEACSLHDDDDALPAGLCLYRSHWHQGVIGILAARIKDRLHRPVIAFAPGGAGELKGSARSIPGLHIRDVLDEVAARHPGLIGKFGGHAMAAGLSLREADYDDFCAAFRATVAARLDEADLQGILHSDGELTAAELNLDTAQALRGGGPWGQAFPEPLFDGVFHVRQRRVVGERHLKLRLAHPDGGAPLDAIAFNALDTHAVASLESERLHLAYRLDVDEYQGSRRVQMIVEHMAADT